MLTRDQTITIPVRTDGAFPLLSDVAIAAGVHLDLRCGGNGLCRRCEVMWEGQLVLACQTPAIRDGLMQIPSSSLVREGFVVESAFAPPVPRHAHPRCRCVVTQVPAPREMPGADDWERLCRAAFGTGERPRIDPILLRKLPLLLSGIAIGADDCANESPVPAGNETMLGTVRLTILDGEVIELESAAQPAEPVLGCAIDIGTTTIVVRLLDMMTGEQLSLAGAQNRQISLGANVISRISIGSTCRGLDLLQKLVVEKTILPLLEKCVLQAGVRGAPIRRAVIGGNTCMLHLFLGLPPNGLGAVPFNAVTLCPTPTNGASLGLPIERVECLPAAGAYIGGDVLGGMYAVGLDHEGAPELLIDFGTNSEMILRVGDKLYGASAAAGPAFEGSGLSCGGPAAPGAITHLHYADGFHFETYKNQPANHICGSAYVDFLAEGRKHGFISEQGRIASDFKHSEMLAVTADSCRPRRRCLLALGVSVDELDVSLLLQAKAAVLAGAQLLLRSAGITANELRTIHVAGGFGRHLHTANSLRIGLLPEVPLDRIKVVGNTSLAACSSALLNACARDEICRLAGRIRIIALNLEPDFEEYYINALSLP
ncbi:MAG: ASKHA domain-containing protein [Planctomycetota bacterium]